MKTQVKSLFAIVLLAPALSPSRPAFAAIGIDTELQLEDGYI